MKKQKYLFIFFLLLSFFSCKRDDDSNIPYYYVNFRIYLNQGSYSVLQAPGNSLVVTNNVIGENETPFGVIIYRANLDEFRAYDRLCSYQPENRCALDVDGPIATCPCCGSKFSMENGYPTKGPASEHLREYRTSFSATELFVSN